MLGQIMGIGLSNNCLFDYHYNYNYDTHTYEYFLFHFSFCMLRYLLVSIVVYTYVYCVWCARTFSVQSPVRFSVRFSVQYPIFLHLFVLTVPSNLSHSHYLTPTIQLPQIDSHSLYPHTQLHTEIKIQRLILSQNITEFRNSCCVTVRTARIIFVFIFI